MGPFTKAPHSPKSLIASVIGVTLSLSSAAQAQSTNADSKEEDSSDSLSLDALSVTAEEKSGYKVDESANKKYTAPLRETPRTITVVSEEVIKDTGSLTLVDALRTVSGITFGAGEGGNPAGDRPIIRGFNAESDSFVDGLRDVASQTREIFNIEQIEVSKGPGSAYQGAGSTGGSINTITKAPKDRNFTDVSFTMGSDQTHRKTLDTNYVLTDTIAVRLNLMKHDANVAGRNGVDVNRWGVAPSITFGLNTPTKLTLSYYHLRNDDMPDYGVPLQASRYTGDVRKPVGGSKDRFYGLTSRDYRHATTDSGFMDFEHHFNENLSVSNKFRYVRTTLDYVVSNPDDSRGNVPNGYVYRSAKSRDSTSDGWVNQTAVMAKLNTWGIGHTINAGYEISYQDTHNRPYTVTGTASGSTCNAALLASHDCTSLTSPTYKDSWNGSIVPGLAYTDTRVETQGIYLFDTVKFNDQWSLNLGVRYDDFENETSGYATRGVVGPFDREKNTTFWSYQFGIVFNPLPNGSIYAAWATSRNPVGETSGEGSSESTAANGDLDPERNQNFELGTKWDFFGGRLGVNAAVFRTKKDNARQTNEDGQTQNIGKTVVDGFELGVSGNITENWQIFANYTYLDGEIESAGATGNDGNDIPSTAENTGSIWTTYKLTPSFTVGGGVNYVDSRYGNDANTIWVPSYTRWDGMASYKLNKNVDFQLNIQNMFNKRYYDQVYASHYAHVGAGRTALLSTNFHF